MSLWEVFWKGKSVFARSHKSTQRTKRLTTQCKAVQSTENKETTLISAGFAIPLKGHNGSQLVFSKVLSLTVP